MSKIFNICTLIFSMLILFSCDPSRDENGDLLVGIKGGSRSGTTPTAGKLIKKISTVSDNGTSLETYTYNNGKLVSSRSEEDGNIDTATLTYDGNIIKNLLVTNSDGKQTLTTDLALTYENGKLTKTTGDSKVGAEVSHKTETNFTYDSNGKISKIVTVYKAKDINNPGTYTESMKQTTEVQFNGDNISLLKLTTDTISAPPITIPPIIIEIVLSDYDTNRNPYDQLPLAYKLASVHFVSGNAFDIGISKNNAKKFTIKGMGTDTTTIMAIEYNSANYPVKMTSPTNKTVVSLEYQ